jgi:quinol monooxygenase YgiN
VVNEYTRYRIPKEKHAAFLSDYTKAADHLRASSACLGYELCQCEEEQDCFILRIIWQSTAAHLGIFRASEEFRRFLPLIKPYIPCIEEMRHYAPTDLRWTRE